MFATCEDNGGKYAPCGTLLRDRIKNHCSEQWLKLLWLRTPTQFSIRCGAWLLHKYFQIFLADFHFTFPLQRNNRLKCLHPRILFCTASKTLITKSWLWTFRLREIISALEVRILSSFSLKVVMLTKTTARTSFEVYSLITFEREYKFVDRHRGMISHIRFCTRPEDPFETVVYTTGLGYFVIMVGNMDGEWHGMKKEEIDVTTINSSMVFQHLLLFEVRMERAICVSHSGW